MRAGQCVPAAPADLSDRRVPRTGAGRQEDQRDHSRGKVAPAATNEPACRPVMNACRTESPAAACSGGGKCAAVMTPATTDWLAWCATLAGAPSPLKALTTRLP